jgi:hypothetical protein
MMEAAKMRVTTIGETFKFLDSISTSSVDPEEIVEKLNALDVDWWITESGDLFIRYWQLGARDFMPPEHVARVLADQVPPAQADKLEWVSQQLNTLRETYSGQWVAITDEGVVASAPDLSQLLAAIDELGQTIEPFITQIPEEAPIWNMTYAAGR